LIPLLLLLLCGLTGCPPQPPDMRPGRIVGPASHAAPPPPAKAVAMDSALHNQALKELQDDLHATDPEVRAHALEALQRAGDATEADVMSALADSDPLVRYGACLAAGQMQLKPAHDTLLHLVDDANPGVGVVARYALHRIGDYTHSHELEKLSRSSDPPVRGSVAMVFGLIGDPSALKILTRMRVDPHPAVRQQAAAAMWQLGDEQGMDDLVGYTFSKYYDDQMMGYLALAEPRRKQIIQHVRVGLTSDRVEVSLVAARAMGLLGSDEGYGIALQCAKSTDPAERIEAAVAMGAIGRSDSQSVLQSLLKDPNADVRIAAAGAILQLKFEG
jgi:HEAT repeat protein